MALRDNAQKQANMEYPAQREEERDVIIIGDDSALHYWMHCGTRAVTESGCSGSELLRRCVQSTSELAGFNTSHPLLGSPPVTVLVPEKRLRAHTRRIEGKLCLADLPSGSFAKLRHGLYIATPEFTFARLGNRTSEAELAEIGTNLCARFFLSTEGDIRERSLFLTTPDSLENYLLNAPAIRGSAKARRAMKWVLPNSGSPMESKVQLLFRLPAWMGGFALPFTHMNYDVSDKRSARLCEQNWYSIDVAAPRFKTGVEYDGAAYHQMAGNDMRRRNALRALGWEVFPMDKSILFDVDATDKLAQQVARHLGIRVRRPQCWESKHAELRRELKLPA